MHVPRTFLNLPWLRLAVTSALLLTAACEDGGGDGPATTADAATTNDTAGGDAIGSDAAADTLAGTDATAATDTSVGTDATAASDSETGSDTTAGSDTQTGSDTVTPVEPAVLVAEAPKLRPFSTTLPDALLDVAFVPGGQFVAAGWTTLPGSPTPTDQAMAVAKFLANGEPDTSFGTGGYATLNIAVGGGTRELARNVAVQSDGKIVLYGTIEHDVAATGGAAADTDVALARFNANGTLDTTFGNQGVVVLDLGTGVVTSATAVAGADVAYGMVVLPDDKLVIHGGTRTGGQKQDGTGERTDLDNFVLRLSKDGAIDTSFGTAGKFSFDIEEANVSPKGILLLPDGSIVGSGYQNTPSFVSVQPVVFKLTPNGALDVSFGVGGVYHQIGLASVTEAYAVAVQGDKLVTAGYGKNAAADTNDWLSLRLSAGGELDTTWGKNGIVQLDAGANLGENCRDLTVLPDGRPLLVGGGQLVEGNTEGLIAVLGADSGVPDTAWATGGIRSYELGGTADQFWSAAVSPDQKLVVVVGLKGVPAAQTTESSNSDGVIVLIALQ